MGWLCLPVAAGGAGGDRRFPGARQAQRAQPAAHPRAREHHQLAPQRAGRRQAVAGGRRQVVGEGQRAADGAGADRDLEQRAARPPSARGVVSPRGSSGGVGRTARRSRRRRRRRGLASALAIVGHRRRSSAGRGGGQHLSPGGGARPPPGGGGDAAAGAPARSPGPPASPGPRAAPPRSARAAALPDQTSVPAAAPGAVAAHDQAHLPHLAGPDLPRPPRRRRASACSAGSTCSRRGRRAITAVRSWSAPGPWNGLTASRWGAASAGRRAGGWPRTSSDQAGRDRRARCAVHGAGSVHGVGLIQSFRHLISLGAQGRGAERHLPAAAGDAADQLVEEVAAHLVGGGDQRSCRAQPRAAMFSRRALIPVVTRSSPAAGAFLPWQVPHLGVRILSAISVAVAHTGVGRGAAGPGVGRGAAVGGRPWAWGWGWRRGWRRRPALTAGVGAGVGAGRRRSRAAGAACCRRCRRCRRCRAAAGARCAAAAAARAAAGVAGLVFVRAGGRREAAVGFRPADLIEMSRASRDAGQQDQHRQQGGRRG